MEELGTEIPSVAFLYSKQRLKPSIHALDSGIVYTRKYRHKILVIINVDSSDRSNHVAVLSLLTLFHRIVTGSDVSNKFESMERLYAFSSGSMAT